MLHKYAEIKVSLIEIIKLWNYQKIEKIDGVYPINPEDYLINI